MLLQQRADGLPSVLYWGKQLSQAMSEPIARAAVEVLLPVPAPAGLGGLEAPGLVGEHWRNRRAPRGLRARRADGTSWSPHFSPVENQVGSTSFTSLSRDQHAGVELEATVEIEPSGVVVAQARLTNLAGGELFVDELAVALPVPMRASQVLSLGGWWSMERTPWLIPLVEGSFVREGIEGRSGHDFPLALVAGTEDLSWGRGEAWAISLAWSGNHRHRVDRFPDASTWISAAEGLLPGEVVLGPGDSYQMPQVVGAWSAEGLDGLSERFHAHVRSKPSYPLSPRPFTANSWEALYFDQRPKRLERLAELAASVGVERFVIDDGWFAGRHNDRAGLGDWWPDPGKFPEGLVPLAQRIRQLSMQVGLWVEPEMVNPDSQLYREHPDWVLGVAGRPALQGRNQLVLDLSRPEVTAYLLERLDNLVGELGLSYLKWDHNRPLAEPAGLEGRPAARSQVLAFYRLVDELRRRHPGLEVESCASGGGRIDLGAMEHCQRVWASDSLDPYDRLLINARTALVLPAELIGSHVGEAVAHVTGRHVGLGLRLASALLAHSGVEWDLTEASEADLAHLRSFVALYKRFRDLLRSGRLLRLDLDGPGGAWWAEPTPPAVAQGVVAKDASEALFVYAQLHRSSFCPPAPLLLRGLDPSRTYELSALELAGPPSVVGGNWPSWWPGRICVPGELLCQAGISLPALGPGQAVALHLSGA